MKKKVLAVLIVLALAAVLAIGTTVAYMTDSEQKVNTFTVGDLDITLTEPAWDDTVDGKVMEPGYTTEKDPTVKAVDGNSYMRVTVEFVSKDNNEMTKERVEKIMETISFENANGVNTASFTKDAKRSTDTKHVYNFNGEFVKDTEVTLFDTVSIPTAWNQNDLAELGKYELVLRAEAIQSYSFENAEAAFTALDGEIEAGTAQEDYKTVDGVAPSPEVTAAPVATEEATEV